MTYDPQLRIECAERKRERAQAVVDDIGSRVLLELPLTPQQGMSLAHARRQIVEAEAVLEELTA